MLDAGRGSLLENLHQVDAYLTLTPRNDRVEDVAHEKQSGIDRFVTRDFVVVHRLEG